MLVGVALLLTALDLVQKALAPVYGHPRGSGYAVVAVTLAALVVAVVPRVPSRALSVAGGVACAGALGNLVSALAWRSGVPNPLVLGAAAFALRHRELLRQPV